MTIQHYIVMMCVHKIILYMCMNARPHQGETEHCMHLTFCFFPTYAGKGIGYMPSAIALAAANKDKIKYIRGSTLKESGQSLPKKACIIDFEKTATKHDNKMVLAAGPEEGNHMHVNIVEHVLFWGSLTEQEWIYY